MTIFEFMLWCTYKKVETLTYFEHESILWWHFFHMSQLGFGEISYWFYKYLIKIANDIFIMSFSFGRLWSICSMYGIDWEESLMYSSAMEYQLIGLFG